MNLPNAIRRHAATLRRSNRGDAPATVWRSLLELSRSGPAPLLPAKRDVGRLLKIAIVIPGFRHGSGGHWSIVRLARELAQLGHSMSLWLEDCEGRHASEPPTLVRRSFVEFFDAHDLDLQTDFGSWEGADVVLATGWQTVPRALLLEGARAKAYLVQDHEPEFYGASAEALFAQDTYHRGLHCLAASKWLAALLGGRYGASASYFDLGIDHNVYRPQPENRRTDLIIFYARAVTPRRAVPLGLLALEELAHRRPELEITLYGDTVPVDAPFRHRNLGILEPPELARLFSRATVGMVFSLTNPSLTGLEMMACGLPCVELASESMLATFGADGPLVLADPNPISICDEVERLLDDAAARDRIAGRGVEFARDRTWRCAAQLVDAALRALAREG